MNETKVISKNFREYTGKKVKSSTLSSYHNILRDDEGIEFINIFKPKTVDKNFLNVSYKFYDVDEKDWWDNISYKEMDSVYLWWVIASINDINNPFEELGPEKRIKIPSKSILYSLFRELKQEALD